MKTILMMLLVLFVVAARAANLKYPVSEIKEELKKDVDAVVREDISSYAILAQNHAILHGYYAITILNPRGDKHAKMFQVYDKLSKINDFSGTVYDADGKQIRKLKSSDIRDQSVFSGSTLFSDDRYKYADLEHNTYPYTVVFEYEKEYKFLFIIDTFHLLPGERVSVQKASYQLSYPMTLTAPRYKLVNISLPPTKLVNGSNTILKWEFNDVAPVKVEVFGNGLEGVLPRIESAPTEFEFDGYKGSMTSWDEFGRWISSLAQGRDNLTPETRAKIHELTDPLKTVEEKARVVYSFVQNRSRYVSIQLGIGGFRPFSADIVDKMGYGDCKALSNYTVALLKEINVKSNYVLISAAENFEALDINFPSSQFNHATVCVPNGKDTLWLECTSQTAPFGYAGKFTGDRDALAITETGAKIVHTTVYPSSVNKRVKSADVTLDATGNAKSKIKTQFSGLEYEYNGLFFALNGTYDDQKKWIEKTLDIPTFDITEFSMNNRKDKIPMATVTASLVLNRLATVTGKRVFLTPNLLSRHSYVPEKLESRKTNVIIKSGHVDYDTIRYTIPEALYPESVPAPIKIKSKFGEYEAAFTMDQGKVIYVRRYVINKGEYSPESYDELIDFFKKVGKADNAKIVFLNRT